MVYNLKNSEGNTVYGNAVGVFVTYKNLSESEYISRLINGINLVKTEDTEYLITEKIHTISQEDIKNIEDKCGLKVLDGRGEIADRVPYILREICKLRRQQLNEKEILIISDNTALTEKLTLNIAKELRFLSIMSKDMTFIDKLEKEVLIETGLSLQSVGKLDRAVQKFDIIISMDSDARLDTSNIKRNAIIIDISIGRIHKTINSNRKDLLIITDLLFRNNGILKSNIEAFSFEDKIPSYIYEGMKISDSIVPVGIRVNDKDYSLKEIVDVYYGKKRNSSVFLSK